MALPRAREALRYYRAAKQRFDDATMLLQAGRTTGAVYPAGYVVECVLKALLLSSVAGGKRRELLAEFRGNRAHNVEWLGALYRKHVRASIPRDVTRHLARVASWSTDLRYATGTIRTHEADGFFDSVVTIFAWADGRM